MKVRQNGPLVADSSPVEGLPRRRLPFVPVLTQSVAAVAPSGAAAVIPALLLTTIGGGASLLSFAVAAGIILLVTACLRPMARRMAAVGGIYTYVARALGPRPAIVTGWSAIVGYASVAMAGLLAVGTYLSHLGVATGHLARSPTALIIALVAAAAIAVTFLMVRGIWISAWTNLIVEAISIAILGTLLTYLLLTEPQEGATFREAMVFDADLRDLSVGVVVAISAFVGFESATTLSRESRQPFRSVPRAILYTPVLASLLYLLAVPIQAITLYAAPQSVVDSPTPLVAMLTSDGRRFLSVLLDLGIATSFFACTLASLNALVRVLFTMGREGVMPRTLGRAHPRFQTPAHAIVISSALVSLAPVAYLVAGSSPVEGLRVFLMLSACGYLGSYLAACVAAPVFLRRIGESTAHIWAVSGAAVLAMSLVILGAAAAALAENGIVLAVYGSTILLAVAHAILIFRVRPDRRARVGIYDETQVSDLLWGGRQ